MAAVTPDTVITENIGSIRLVVAKFANTVDDADTWDSGIDNIIAVAASQADAPATQASTGAGASYSDDVITLHLGEDNTAVTLLVFARGT